MNPAMIPPMILAMSRRVGNLGLRAGVPSRRAGRHAHRSSRAGLASALRVVGLLVTVVASVVLQPSSAKADTQAIANAIAELDVERARELLEEHPEGSDELSYLRARLAVYTADCDTAEAILGPLKGPEHVLSLLDLATRCSRAVAGAKIFEDQERAVWIRFQDDEDVVLAPYLVEVAAAARDSAERDLGVSLPRPLRIDLVRDLFSLSAVSGLPVSAAETTGTVAVARWARVSMISPRAASHGYPWEDTLAHEIAHLVLSRATRDYAPLWLQEGIAKRLEVRWRSVRPFDKTPSPDDMARKALLMGNDVGITNLGQSIAMLPTPEAAGIAYAEVESFVSFWVRENGEQAFKLLLQDLKGLGIRDPDAAMVSVSGYGLEDWIQRWRHHLLTSDEPTAQSVGAAASPANDAASVAHGQPGATAGAKVGFQEVLRRVRLGDLTFDRQSFPVSLRQYETALAGADDDPVLRYRAARSHLAVRQLDAAESVLGRLEDTGGLNGRWLALSALTHRMRQRGGEAERRFSLAVGLDPYAVEVACEGYDPKRVATPPAAVAAVAADDEAPRAATPSAASSALAPLAAADLPSDEMKRQLCEAALRIPRE